jgi:hypothetical protein
MRLIWVKVRGCATKNVFFNIPDAIWNVGYFIKKRGVIALYLYR